MSFIRYLMLYRRGWLIAAVIALAALTARAAAETQAPLPTESVVIVSGETRHALTLELADDPEETRIGMMGRTSVPEMGGMLFDFGQPRPVTMWMKNVPIFLDLLFVDPNGVIIAIAENARPQSQRLLGPSLPVRGVIELGGGRARALGIKPGDRVEHRLFEPAQ
jgi:uncharacterized membrane protein (UPF0127 family)